jgi:hypothetical protein
MPQTIQTVGAVAQLSAAYTALSALASSIQAQLGTNPIVTSIQIQIQGGAVLAVELPMSAADSVSALNAALTIVQGQLAECSAALAAAMSSAS